VWSAFICELLIFSFRVFVGRNTKNLNLHQDIRHRHSFRRAARISARSAASSNEYKVLVSSRITGYNFQGLRR
jgi:hypothetical protein